MICTTEIPPGGPPDLVQRLNAVLPEYMARYGVRVLDQEPGCARVDAGVTVFAVEADDGFNHLTLRGLSALALLQCVVPGITVGATTALLTIN